MQAGYDLLPLESSNGARNYAGGTSVEAQVGFILAQSKARKWDIYGGAGYRFDFSGASYSGWKGNLGLRRNW